MTELKSGRARVRACVCARACVCVCVVLPEASGTDPASSPPPVSDSEMLLARGLSFFIYSLSVKLMVAFPLKNKKTPSFVL